MGFEFRWTPSECESPFSNFRGCGCVVSGKERKAILLQFPDM